MAVGQNTVPMVNIEHRWQMDVHPPQNAGIGYAPHGHIDHCSFARSFVACVGVLAGIEALHAVVVGVDEALVGGVLRKARVDVEVQGWRLLTRNPTTALLQGEVSVLVGGCFSFPPNRRATNKVQPRGLLSLLCQE